MQLSRKLILTSFSVLFFLYLLIHSYSASTKDKPTNLNEFLNEQQMFTQLAYGIKDIMIDDDKIYISYTDEIEQNCFNISLLEGKISNDKIINFQYFS